MATTTGMYAPSTSALIRRVEMTTDTDGSIDVAAIQNKVNARCVDVVSIPTPEGVLDFWLDDEGLFDPNPQVNPTVMWLMYALGAPLHQLLCRQLCHPVCRRRRPHHWTD